MKIYLLVGIPGSGKTYWAEHFLNDNKNSYILSTDAIRTMLYGKYDYRIQDEDLIKKICQSGLKQMIINVPAESNIIIDDCNLTKVIRKKKFNIICEANAHRQQTKKEWLSMKIINFKPHAKNLEWRMRAAKGISEKQWYAVIKAMKESYEQPTEEELGSPVTEIDHNQIKKYIYKHEGD